MFVKLLREKEALLSHCALHGQQQTPWTEMTHSGGAVGKKRNVFKRSSWPKWTYYSFWSQEINLKRLYKTLYELLLRSLRADPKVCNIANVWGLSSTLDGDDGIAAPKKNIVHIFAISGGVGGIFLPFFFLCSKRTAYWLNQRTFCTLLSRRAKLWFVWESPTKVDQGWPF